MDYYLTNLMHTKSGPLMAGIFQAARYVWDARRFGITPGMVVVNTTFGDQFFPRFRQKIMKI